jgi:hypothetical protein
LHGLMQKRGTLMAQSGAGCCKRGVDDGNQKVGTFSSRRKKAIDIISYLHKIKSLLVEVFGRIIMSPNGDGAKSRLEEGPPC